MFRRLFWSFIAIVMVTVLSMVLATTYVIDNTFNNFRDIHLDAHLHHVPHELFLFYQKHDSWSDVDVLVDQMSRALNMDIVLVDVDDRIMASTLSEMTALAILANEEAADYVIPLRYGAPEKLFGTAYFKSGSLLKRRDSEFLRRLSLSALLVGLTVGLLAMLFSFILARSISQPIIELSKIAEAIGRGNYAAKSTIQQKNEVGLLSNTINQMSTEISQLEKLRRNLVLNVSHDLRTPLTIVNGYLEGLRTGKIVDRRTAEHAFEMMHHEVENLIMLIDSLNEVAALDSGEFPLNRNQVSVSYMIAHVLGRISPSAERKEITITSEIDVGVPTAVGKPQIGSNLSQSYLVWVDADKIDQVLYNLLDNAIHYSSTGSSIHIRGIVVDDELRFTVIDKGEGVLPEHQPFIFERFYRADQVLNRQERGYGMGLSIVQSIVHAHGGEVVVISSGNTGEGTEMRVTIPLKESS